MSWLSSITGGVVGGVAEPLSEYGQSRQETAQWRYRAQAIAEIAAASWRPWLARLLGLSIAVHVATSVVLLYVLVYAQVYQTDWSIVSAWALWMSYGRELFSLTVTLLGIYLGSRGAEKIAPSLGGQAGDALGTAASWVTGRKREPDIVQGEVRERDTPIQRMPGIVRTQPAVDSLYKSVPEPTQKWQWGARSQQRLSHARRELQQLFDWLLPRSPYDLMIAETIRTLEDQREYFANGTSKTMRSRHLEKPAAAVDFYILDPVTGKALLGKDQAEIDKYIEVLNIAKAGSILLEIPITSGGLDWHWDYFHIELDRKHYPQDLTHIFPPA